MSLSPITTRNPTTCDECGAAIARHAMVYFADVVQDAKGGRYNVCCSPECVRNLETQPKEENHVRD